MSEATQILEFVVALLKQRCDGVAREEFRGDTLGRRFPRDRLRAILAELERGSVLLVRPCTAGTIEAIGLIRPKKRDWGRDALHLLAHGLSGRPQRTPAARGSVVGPDTWYFTSRGHRKLQ